MSESKHTMRMDAYYYGFDRTNVELIDSILSAVACAGKAYHLTEDWKDKCEPSEPIHRGENPVEWIQNAAIDAARSYNALKARNAELVKAIEFILKYEKLGAVTEATARKALANEKEPA